MAFDIASFKSNLRNGGARPNLFEVEVGNPIDGSADSAPSGEPESEAEVVDADFEEVNDKEDKKSA